MVLCLASITNCGERESDAPASSKIVEQIDLGSLPIRNNAIATNIVFRNNENTPIRIVRANADCSCVVPELNKNDGIEPGETIEIPITISYSSAGSFQRKVFLWTDKDENNPYIYIFKGKVYYDVLCKPERVVFYLNNEDEKETIIYVYFRDAKHGVSEVTTSLEYVTVGVKKMIDVNREHYEITFKSQASAIDREYAKGSFAYCNRCKGPSNCRYSYHHT